MLFKPLVVPLSVSTWRLDLDVMNPSRFGLEDEDDEEDAALQYMIDQSLQESNKQRGLHRESSPGTKPRSVQEPSSSPAE